MDPFGLLLSSIVLSGMMVIVLLQVRQAFEYAPSRNYITILILVMLVGILLFSKAYPDIL
jgi:hypothetical protein